MTHNGDETEPSPFRVSEPINSDGDRILVPGDPHGLERMVRRKNLTAKAQARERIRTTLEKTLPGLLHVLDDETYEGLMSVILSLCNQTAKGYGQHLTHIASVMLKQIPTYDQIPDPRQNKNLMTLQTNPDENSCAADGAHLDSENDVQASTRDASPAEDPSLRGQGDLEDTDDP